METLQDKDLIDLALAGDTRAFTVLADRHIERMGMAWRHPGRGDCKVAGSDVRLHARPCFAVYYHLRRPGCFLCLYYVGLGTAQDERIQVVTLHLAPLDPFKPISSPSSSGRISPGQ